MAIFVAADSIEPLLSPGGIGERLMLTLPESGVEAALLPVRLIGHTAVHFGWWHFIANAVWLIVFGVAMLRRTGIARFCLLYFGGGVAGGLAFLLVALCAGSRQAALCGASSAVLAVAAAALVAIPDYRYTYPVLRHIRLKYLAIPAFFTAFICNISLFSMAAHVGGIIFGLIFGFIFCKNLNSAKGEPLAPQTPDASVGSPRDAAIRKLRRSGFSALTSEERRQVSDNSRQS